MDIRQIIYAMLVGMIEGLTEALPISSSAHRDLFETYVLSHQFIRPALFGAMTQWGAGCAILWYYRALWKDILEEFFSLSMSKPLTSRIFLAFGLFACIGYVAHAYMKHHLGAKEILPYALIIGGIIMLAIERFMRSPIFFTLEKIPLPIAGLIGCSQLLAVMPGVSRSGITIAIARLCKIDHTKAVAFSFLVAIPTYFSILVEKGMKELACTQLDEYKIISIGAISAFLTGLLCMRFTIGFLCKKGLTFFGWYRILLGSMIMIFCK